MRTFADRQADMADANDDRLAALDSGIEIRVRGLPRQRITWACRLCQPWRYFTLVDIWAHLEQSHGLRRTRYGASFVAIETHERRVA